MKVLSKLSGLSLNKSAPSKKTEKKNCRILNTYVLHPVPQSGSIERNNQNISSRLKDMLVCVINSLIML